MYVKTDPRSNMASASSASKKKAPTEFGPSYYGRFYDEEPQQRTDRASSWYIRSQNAVLSYSRVTDGAEFVREEQPDEFALLLPTPTTTAEITAGGETVKVTGSSVTFVPPDRSTIRISGDGDLVRVFTARAVDLVELCSNSKGYVDDPNVPELEAWPTPPDGFKIRTYDLDVPQEEGRFGRIFRSTNIMLNCFYSRMGRRDPRELSPHHHDDFQQFSLVLEGSYYHHLRRPWAPDKTKWADDEHEFCAAPSACVIPAAVIHTSEPYSHVANQLVDIFCPPREDFSAQPGWVLNADDYPAKPRS
jgi:hypothetical protein